MYDVDTFLTTVYVVVTEYDKAHWPPPAGAPAGRRPALSRSAVVTLVIFAQWASFGSERGFYRFAQRHLRAAFPNWPTRRQFDRQVRTGAVQGDIYGEPPDLTNLDSAGNLKFTTDFRSVYATVLDRWLGAPADAVLGGSFGDQAFLPAG